MDDFLVIRGRFCLTIFLVAASCRALPHYAVAEQGKICSTIQIRKVSDFSGLENCRVIEGNLSIVLIHSEYWGNFSGSFPKLNEITDTLILYSVEGLKSLGQLFPNLAVIGGKTLFYGYAFVAFNLFDLEDIGLFNLTVIRNGAVRIEENPRLCYIDTVDWGKITKGVSADENYFKSNTAGCLDICPSQCDSTDVQRCWNAEHCQKMLSCPPECESGYCHGDECCHSQCIGGCSGPLASQCTSCDALIDSPDHSQGTCLQTCPSGLYLYKNRICLTADQCINFADYKSDGESCDESDCMKLVTMTGEDLDQTLVCSVGCPAGYQPDSDDKTRCVSCTNGICPKVCKGMTIDSMEHAKELKDCTSINGSLHFRLKNCLDEDKLEEYLDHITEVTGYIDVSDSYGLHSLRMLKGLQKLGGQQLLNNKYALHVFNNQNLRELLPEESLSGFELVRGSVLFQQNGKLNYDRITEFLSKVGIEKNNNDGDISKETNGDKLTLQTQKLQLTLKSISSGFVSFSWSAMQVKNPQDLIGYSIKWKEVSEQSIIVIPEDDICQEAGWNSFEVGCNGYKCKKETVFSYVSNLKPATQYAMFVRPVTVTDESAVSNVLYFRTLAGIPTEPLNVRMEAKTPGALHLTWYPPAQPNAIFIKYRITYTHIPIRPEEYSRKDYCSIPLLEIEKEKQSESTNCCACSESSTIKYTFHDKLQNTFYVKRKDIKKSSRNRRGASTNENENRRTHILYVFDKELSITNLGNYEKYSIKVQACHNEGESKEIVCSDSVIVSGKTLPDASNDAIPKLSLEGMTGGIELKWQDPPNPNGIILTYEIEYVAGHMDQSENVCVPNDKAGDNEYELTSLAPGNYMIRIRATSLAGVGPWTSYLHFTV